MGYFEWAFYCRFFLYDKKFVKAAGSLIFRRAEHTEIMGAALENQAPCTIWEINPNI